MSIPKYIEPISSHHRFFAGWGKRQDSLAYILNMALSSNDGARHEHLECLSLRPYAVQCPVENANMWFSSAIDPWDGIFNVLRAVGVLDASIVLSVEEPRQDLFYTIESMADRGPVIVGPLDKNVIWDRPASKYYRGDAYFLLIVSTIGASQFVAHDAEGCPYLLISAEKLFSALEAYEGKKGFVQILTSANTMGSELIYFRSLINGLEVREKLNGAQTGMEAIRSLARVLENRFIKSSETASLSFGLTNYASMLIRIQFLIAGIERGFRSRPPQWQVEALRDLKTILSKYELAIALTRSKLLRNHVFDFVQNLFDLAEYEKEIDIAMRPLVSITA